MQRIALPLLLAAVAASPLAVAQTLAPESEPARLESLAPSSAIASALAPRTIPYQGVLTDATGAPVPDATYAIGIALHLAVTGGSATYSETHSVATVGGVFSVPIGGGSLVSGSWSNVVFDRPWWIETSVDATALTPRIALAATPFARGLALPLVAQSSDPGTAFTVTSSVTTGSSIAGVFQSASTTGRGVFGLAAAASGENAGVLGASFSDEGWGVVGEAPTYGVFGRTTRLSDFAYGVWGESESTTGRGVLGKATSTTGVTYGVVGQSDSDAGRAVYGVSTSPTGTPSGVYGRVTSPNGYAGYFVGGQGVRVEGEVAASRIVYTSPRTHVVSIPPSAFRTERPFVGGGKSVEVGLGFGGAYLAGEDNSVLANGPIVAPLMLPDGAEVTDFSCNVHDINNLDVSLTCRLVSTQETTNFIVPTVLATTPLSTSSGYEELMANFTAFTVDNQTSAYSIEVSASGTDYWTEEGIYLRVLKVTVGYRVSEAE